MRKYKATKLTMITEGRVKMAKPQAFMRSGHLKPIPGKPDEYEIVNQVVLVPGEIVEVVTPDPKALGLELVDSKQKTTKQAAKKK